MRAGAARIQSVPMSLSFLTKIRGMPVAHLVVSEIERCLRSMSSGGPKPIVLQRFEEGAVSTLSDPILSPGGYLVTQKDTDSVVQLLLYDIETETPWEPAEGMRYWATVEVSGSRTAAALSLGVATIVALSAFGTGVVIDPAMAVARRRERRSEGFLGDYLKKRARE